MPPGTDTASASHLGAGAARFAAALACAAVLGGCAFQEHRKALERMHAAGDYAAAAADLDAPGTQSLYGEKNRVLLWMDRGAVALALKDDQQCIDQLEKAEEYMDVHRDRTAGDQAARWLLDDTAVPYIAGAYEDMYVNVFKLLAQLEQGRIEGGATVEARRLANKANVLRDKFLEYRSAMNSRGGAGFDGAASRTQPGLGASNDAGNFIESPLGTFLTAVTFMKSGDRSNQGVAGRRLVDSIRLQQALIGPVREDDFADIGSRDPATGSVLVVGLSGRGPTKEAQRIGPIPVFDWPVYFELPVLVGGSREVGSVRAVVSETLLADDARAASPDHPPADDPGSPGQPEPCNAFPLALVEDLCAVSTENHRRELPNIYARTLLRSSLKAGASFALTQAVRHQGHGHNNDAAVIGAILLGLAAVTATERADLRCWAFLPGQAHVALLDLPPGEHRVKLEYYGHNGGLLYTTPWRDVTVPADGKSHALSTIIEHYWR